MKAAKMVLVLLGRGEALVLFGQHAASIYGLVRFVSFISFVEKKM